MSFFSSCLSAGLVRKVRLHTHIRNNSRRLCVCVLKNYGSDYCAAHERCITVKCVVTEIRLYLHGLLL